MGCSEGRRVPETVEQLLKITEVGIASEVSMSSKNLTLAIADVLSKKTQLANYCETRLPPPPAFAFPKPVRGRLGGGGGAG